MLVVHTNSTERLLLLCEENKNRKEKNEATPEEDGGVQDSQGEGAQEAGT